MEILRSISDSLTQKEVIQTLISSHVDNGFSVALWKLPGDDDIQLILSQSQLNPVQDIQLEELEPGFIIAPFNRTDLSYHLKAETHFVLRNNEVTLLTPGKNWSSEKETNEQLSNVLRTHRKNFNSATIPKNKFIELVEKSINSISEGQFEKVVPSRCALLDERTINPLQVFENLCHQHPNAMVSLVSTPKTGTWIGASPELLVSIDNRQIFKTVSLAGTQPIQNGTNLRSVAWTQKEIEEQALVSRYIINCFKKIRLREFEEHGPKTVQAGNLLHLKTEFEVDMQATNFPQLGTVMIKLLHPTSAVCGMPHENAFSFLKEQEGYNREYYSGFLGPVNINNSSHLYVNLRCMQWTLQGPVLYAGAGVTIDSTPEQEWAETELKIQSLTTSLNN